MVVGVEWEKNELEVVDVTSSIFKWQLFWDIFFNFRKTSIVGQRKYK